MKRLLLILSALIFGGCAIYIIKVEPTKIKVVPCEKETQAIWEWLPYQPPLWREQLFPIDDSSHWYIDTTNFRQFNYGIVQ